MEFVKTGVQVDGFLEKEIQAAILPACREFDRAVNQQTSPTFEEGSKHYEKGMELYKALLENPPIPEINHIPRIQLHLYLSVMIGTAGFFQSLVLHFRWDDPKRKAETEKLNKTFLEFAKKAKPLLATSGDFRDYQHVCRVMGVTPP
jgi:hypothetical protein